MPSFVVTLWTTVRCQYRQLPKYGRSLSEEVHINTLRPLELRSQYRARLSSFAACFYERRQKVQIVHHSPFPIRAQEIEAYYRLYR
jgi:hypothetical protein